MSDVEPRGHVMFGEPEEIDLVLRIGADEPLGGIGRVAEAIAGFADVLTPLAVEIAVGRTQPSRWRVAASIRPPGLDTGGATCDVDVEATTIDREAIVALATRALGGRAGVGEATDTGWDTVRVPWALVRLPDPPPGGADVIVAVGGDDTERTRVSLSVDWRDGGAWVSAPRLVSTPSAMVAVAPPVELWFHAGAPHPDGSVQLTLVVGVHWSAWWWTASAGRWLTEDAIRKLEAKGWRRQGCEAPARLGAVSPDLGLEEGSTEAPAAQ